MSTPAAATFARAGDVEWRCPDDGLTVSRLSFLEIVRDCRPNVPAVDDIVAGVRSIIWMSEKLSRALREQLSSETTSVSSAREFLAAASDAETVSFVDDTTIAAFDEATKIGSSVEELRPRGPTIAVCDGTLQSAIGWLKPYPWLSQVIGATMLSQPMAKEHLENVTRSLTKGSQPKLLDWLGPTVAGRRVRLTHASKRVERLERMGEFFEGKAVGSRTIQLLRDVAEELLTNAFYDAPVAAGTVKQPISRTQDVSLPENSACDMVYGCNDDIAIVRVRDPFGALARQRLVEVLTRCARTDMQVEVDETMGGAGLGLWRIFSLASFVAIAVVNHHHTEFLVGVRKKPSSGPRPFAFHLFFKENGKPARRWKLLDADSTKPSVNQSVTIVTK